MSKYIKSVLLVLIFSTIFAACTQEGDMQDDIDPTNTNFTFPSDDLTLYKSVSLDESSVGADHGFTGAMLYTTAGKDEDGEFMWDDSQEFALVVEHDSGYHELIPRQMIQLGEIDFKTFYEVETNDFHVLAEYNQMAGVKIVDFVYDEEKGEFNETVVYEASNINYMQEAKARE